ncbi:MAG: diguanylate cyclase [Micromonosporaceae bacterium]|nr:diguanylate cyclase [Micromonosporaceae bacterium]
MIRARGDTARPGHPIPSTAPFDIASHDESIFPGAIPGILIEQELGRGAFTVVYRGVRDGREYAVKVLRVADPESEAAFHREAAALARLNDPGLVGIHEVGETRGRPYSIMDLVRGRPLAQVLRSGSVPHQRVIDWGARIAGALAAAHRAGLVHRDVKPANIMIDICDEARLIDFGLVGRTGVDLGEAAVGTFAYSAPEQTGMLRRAVDGRADLYSLGVVLFEALTGQLPFTAADAGELIQLHLARPAPDVRQVCDDVPESLAAIVAKLLAKDPDDRYQTGQGLRADLVRVGAGERAPFPLGTADVTASACDLELIGRREEVDLLLSRWNGAVAGHGGLVLVKGPPGIGKSRLVRELTSRVLTTGIARWYARGFRDNAAPFALLRNVIDDHLRWAQRLPDPARAAALSRARAAAGDAGVILAQISPAMAMMLGLPEPVAIPTGAGQAKGFDDPSGRYGDEQQQFTWAFAEFITALAVEEGGLIIHIDDLEWCDEASRRVLGHLASQLPTTPLLILATVRGSDPLGDIVDCAVTLGPFDQAEVAAQVASELGSGTVPDQLVTQLYNRSGGNPMAVREYLNVMIDEGLIRPAWGRWIVDDHELAGLMLADDVTDLIVRRLEWLDDDSRRLLATAAVVGVRFDPALVGSVCEVAEDQVLATLSDAVADHLVEPVPGGQYCFLHDRIRDILIAGIDAAECQRLHQRIAQDLEAGGAASAEQVYAIADHYLMGKTDRDVRPAHRTAVAAALLALAEHAASNALEYFQQAEALATAGGIIPDVDVHVGAGIAAARIGRFAESDHHFDRALAVETDPLRRAEIFIRLTDTHQQRWEGECALDMVRSGLAELGTRLPVSLAGAAVSSIGALLSGLIIGGLPRRLREVTGRRRATWELRTELLNAGAQAAAAANRIPLVMVFNLLALPAANRLGSGWPFLRSRVNLAILARLMGLRSVATRQFDIAEGAITPGNPKETAFVVWGRSLADDFVCATNARSGQATRQCLDQHGRWMEAGDMITSVGMLGVFEVVRGYPSRAARLYDLTVEYTQDANQILGTTLGIVSALAAVMLGDPARAAAGLREVREFLTTIPYNHSQQVNVAFAATVLAVEQGETGTVLEDALAEYAALNVKLSQSWPFQRMFWLYQAFGRLAQVAATDPGSRAEPLARAAKAVSLLRKAADGQLLDAFARVAGASLRQLRGDNDGALRALARCADRLTGLDAPLAQYEAAVVAVRALCGLGLSADACRQASVARLLASEGGWQTRCRWIEAEFGAGAIDACNCMAWAARAISRDEGPESADRRTDGGKSPRRRSRQPASHGDGLGRHDRAMRALHQVSLAAATVLDPTQLARVALDEIVQIFAAERAFLFLVEDRTELLAPHVGRSAERADIERLTGYGASLVDRVRATGEPIVVTGSEHGAALGSQSALVHGLRSIMVAPLTLRGRIIGVIYLDSRAARGIFVSEDAALLTAVTASVALSLETARAAALEVSVQVARHERDTAELLRGAMRDLTESLDPWEVSVRLLSAVVGVLPDTVAFLIHREEDGSLSLARSAAADEPSGQDGRLEQWRPLDVSQHPVVRDLLGIRAAVCGVCGRDRLPLPADLPAETQAWLVVPLAARGVRWGLLIAATGGRPYTEAEAEVAAALAGQGMVALDNAMLFRQVEETAARDWLTGLYNLRHFVDLAEQHVAAWQETQRLIAVIMADIDHFKAVNDRYGHGVGDEVIREVARRLAAELRDSDIVGRYGGEEFVILLTETTVSQAEGIARCLRRAVSGQRFATTAGLLPITVSVGLAFPGQAREGLFDLLRIADEALYAAKRGGRDRVAVAGDRE